MKRSMSQNNYDFISISHYFYPRIGGLENVAYNLVKGLEEKNINSLAIHGGAKERYSTTIEDFNVEAFKTLDIFDKTYPLFGLKYFFFLNKILGQNPNAQVLIHSRHLTSSYIAAKICVLKGHPYYVLEHNAGPVYFESSFVSEIANWVDKYFFRYVFKKATNVISVSKTGRRWVSKNFKIPKKYIAVIYNSYNEKEITNSFTTKQNIAVWAAKRIPVKDVNTVIRGYKRIAEKFPDWKFIVIGEGPDLNTEGLNFPSNIEIIPEFLKQEDLFRLLRKSKIYVNTSLSEGLSVGILEALSFGNIPVISSAPSNQEIARKAGTEEFVFERRNSRDLADKLMKAITRSKDTEYLKEIAKRTKDLFSNTRMIERYFEYLFPSHYANEQLQKLSIIIPAYNEENTIEKILEKVVEVELPNELSKEIIIVDDASTDKTLALSKTFIKANGKKAEFKILENKNNLGKSKSVKKGAGYSTGGLVVVQDADLEYDPNNLVKFVEMFLKRPETDVIYGNRFNKSNKFISLTHSLGNKFVTAVSNVFTRLHGFAPKDMETCYKMSRGDIFRELMERLESTTNFGLEPEITAKFARYRKQDNRKLQLRQIDISYKPRTEEQNKKMRWFKHGREAIVEIIRFNLKKY